jgi:3-oxoacyl-[acyl-carrier protein] reductase
VIPKIVLITGASRGLGARLVRSFLSQGWMVIGVARSSIDVWEGEADLLFERQSCDITDESMVKRLFSDIRKRHGRLDALINNAGAFSADLLLTASGDRFRMLLQTNLVGSHLITREAVKLMRPRGFGRVVNISSIAAVIPMAGNALYATSKAALESLAKGYAVEFKGGGVTFNSIRVSFVEDTNMVGALKSAARGSYEARLLVPEPLMIEEIMHALNFFISEDAPSITGQIITLGSPS